MAYQHYLNIARNNLINLLNLRIPRYSPNFNEIGFITQKSQIPAQIPIYSALIEALGQEGASEEQERAINDFQIINQINMYLDDLDGVDVAQLRSNPQEGSGLKSNPWISHVKQVQKKHGISYKEAMKIAKKTYK